MLRMALFRDDVRPCEDFCPSGTDVSLILKFILPQFLPKYFWGFSCLLGGFSLLLHAQVPGGIS